MTTEEKANLAKFLDEECRTLEEALKVAFDEVYDGDEGYVKARCCGGEVRYRSGLYGTDFAQCPTCKSEIRMILSPHVSPILLGPGTGCTHMPTDELVDAVGDRLWWVSKLYDAVKANGA